MLRAGNKGGSVELHGYAYRADSGTDAAGDQADSSVAAYAFIYPNTMLNAYGRWVDTNVVTPLTADSCSVAFEWFLHGERPGDEAHIEQALAASHEVQLEDVALCEDVQRGLLSPAYDTGRWALCIMRCSGHAHCILSTPERSQASPLNVLMHAHAPPTALPPTQVCARRRVPDAAFPQAARKRPAGCRAR